MKSRTHATARLLIAVLVCAVTVSAQAQGTTADAELTKLADDFSQAWAKGDAKAIAALHTQDAIRLPGTGQVITGRAAIEQNYMEGLSGPWKGSKIAITPGQTKQVTPDVYVSEGRFQITGGTPPAGASTSGQYANTFVRQGGRWLLASSAVLFPPPAR
jgi:uncharacterized protein (TIGR02246 family)